MKEKNKPTKKELAALELFYNRFYDLYDELSSDTYFEKDSNYRWSSVV